MLPPVSGRSPAVARWALMLSYVRILTMSNGFWPPAAQQQHPGLKGPDQMAWKSHAPTVAPWALLLKVGFPLRRCEHFCLCVFAVLEKSSFRIWRSQFYCSANDILALGNTMLVTTWSCYLGAIILCVITPNIFHWTYQEATTNSSATVSFGACQWVLASQCRGFITLYRTSSVFLQCQVIRL